MKHGLSEEREIKGIVYSQSGLQKSLQLSGVGLLDLHDG